VDLGLRGRLAVITGASAGIGRATALALADEGAALVVAARDAGRLDGLAEEARERGAADVTSVAGDMTAGEGLDRLRAAVESRPAWALVTCVGSTPLGDFDQIDDQTWARAVEMKFMATVRAIRAVLPSMRRSGGGRIVLVAGNTALEPDPWMVTSGAMNAALGNLAASLGRQVASEGIGVVAVHPGPTRSSRFDALEATLTERFRGDVEAAREHLHALSPRGVPAEPEEIGAAISYLCSPKAAHVTATSVGIDGGQSWAR
jgi:3-oxoacyl-[acyl-carrier protein] reductase